MNASNCVHFQNAEEKKNHVKPILLYFKMNSDLLNLHVCKSKPCCWGSQQVCLIHIWVTGVSQCVFKTGVLRTDGFYCSFVGFNQMILSVSS